MRAQRTFHYRAAFFVGATILLIFADDRGSCIQIQLPLVTAAIVAFAAAASLHCCVVTGGHTHMAHMGRVVSTDEHAPTSTEVHMIDREHRDGGGLKTGM